MQGTGIKLGNIILAVTSVLIALAICFYSSWELSLVFILAFTLVFLAYRLVNKFYYETGSGDDDYLQVSSHVVLETVDNVKTVVSLGAQEYFIGRINQYLRSHTWYIPVHVYTSCIILWSYVSLAAYVRDLYIYCFIHKVCTLYVTYMSVADPGFLKGGGQSKILNFRPSEVVSGAFWVEISTIIIELRERTGARAAALERMRFAIPYAQRRLDMT